MPCPTPRATARLQRYLCNAQLRCLRPFGVNPHVHLSFTCCEPEAGQDQRRARPAGGLPRPHTHYLLGDRSLETFRRGRGSCTTTARATTAPPSPGWSTSPVAPPLRDHDDA